MGIRIKSGIPGLDSIIGGGFELGSVILASGGPGTGKTTFCLQFIMQGAKDGENCLYASFEETVDDLIRDALSYGWDLESYIKSGKITIVHFSPFEYDKFKEDFSVMLKRKKIKRVAIDSISGIGFYLKDIYELRKNIFELSKIIKDHGCTGIMTSEIVAEQGYSRFQVEEFLSDGLIALHFGGLGGDFDRSLQVIKMRRTNHKKGLFAYRITNKGISVSTRQA
jgi:circadian clock protein KaiC